MLRMIALDLDGTLLRSDKTLSARTRQVLESYIAKGTHVVVASGRSYDSLPQEVLSVSGIDYAITYNGVVICHRPTGEKLFYSPLKPACTQQLLSLIQTHHAEFEVFLDGVPVCRCSVRGAPHRIRLAGRCDTVHSVDTQAG